MTGLVGRSSIPQAELAAPWAEGELSQALAALVSQGLAGQGRLWVPLQGDSMWPTIAAGSLVEVERVAPDQVGVGDIAVWQQDGQLIAHRVVETARRQNADGLITKGDNCSRADEWLPRAAVIGRVVAVRRENGVWAIHGTRASRVHAGFWIGRWRARSVLGRAGRLLPRSMRRALGQVRDRLGFILSQGVRAVALRR